jgi:hypothetical protein
VSGTQRVVQYSYLGRYKALQRSYVVPEHTTQWSAQQGQLARSLAAKPTLPCDPRGNDIKPTQRVMGTILRKRLLSLPSVGLGIQKTRFQHYDTIDRSSRRGTATAAAAAATRKTQRNPWDGRASELPKKRAAIRASCQTNDGRRVQRSSFSSQNEGGAVDGGQTMGGVKAGGARRTRREGWRWVGLDGGRPRCDG